MKRWLLTALWAGLAACSSPPAPVAGFVLQTPRPFGYLNGEQIRHRIEFVTRNGVRLQRAGLPQRGAINRWLNLNQLTVTEDRRGDGFHYQIDLTYQVFYAPLEVKMLTIPGFNLPLAQGANTAVQAVPPWRFTLSPLRELSIRKDESGEYLRPDAAPQVAVSGRLLPSIAACGLLFLLSAAYLGFNYGLLPGLPPRRVFKAALRDIARLSPAQWGEALTVFHHALNALNAAPLFGAQLSGFYRRHPDYLAVATELTWFFACSDRHFFAGGADADTDWSRLQRLCAQCRDLERGER